MGHGIALKFAQYNCNVIVYDPNDVSLNSLEKLSKILKKLDKWDANEIEHTIKNFLKDEGLNFKDIGLPLRAVLVGFLSPIGINTIIESLGKDEVLARIEDIIK